MIGGRWRERTSEGLEAFLGEREFGQFLEFGFREHFLEGAAGLVCLLEFFEGDGALQVGLGDPWLPASLPC